VLDGGVRVALDAVLVPQNLPVELVDQAVDRGIHVFLGRFGVQAVAAHAQRNLGLLAQFLHGKQYIRLYEVVEVPPDTFDLGNDVTMQGRRNFDVMTVDDEVHAAPLFRMG
jgi:hypothetical protein